MINNKDILFSIRRIKTEQFAIFGENFEKDLSVSLKFGLEFKISETQKALMLIMSFAFVQSEKPFIKIDVSYDVHFPDESWDKFYHIDKTKIIFPKKFIGFLATTFRDMTSGILFAKTEGTEWNKFIIPIKDMRPTIASDIEYQLVNG